MGRSQMSNSTKDNTMSNAGLTRRYLAVLLDTILLLGVLLSPFFLLVNKIERVALGEELNLLINLGTWFLFGFLMFGFVSMVYTVYLTSHLKGTLGKLLFGLNVLDQKTMKGIDLRTSLYRSAVGYSASATFMWLGFLGIKRHPKKLAWHDELFGTRVAIVGSWYLGAIALTILLGILLWQVGNSATKIFELIELINSVNS